MLALLGISSVIGFFVCVILLIIAKVKKNGKVKKWGIGTGACFVVFVIALIVTPGLTPEQIAQAKTANELKVKQAAEVEAKTAADKIVADAKAKVDAEAKAKQDAARSQPDPAKTPEPTKVADTTKPAEPAKPTASVTAPASTPAPEPKVVTPAVTVSQNQAVMKAKSYLDYSSFSREGLIKQLEFEGFTIEDATYGVGNSGADWMKQAVAKAKSYLDYSSFSKNGLIEQLKFDGFTQEQAEFGVLATGL